MFPKDTILAGYVGSMAHGTRLDPSSPNFTDDIDIMGVYIGGIENYFGLSRNEHSVTQVDEYDLTFYEIRKFFSLMLKSNPNVMTLLWNDEYLQVTELGRWLLDNRDVFVSKQVYQPFIGYSFGQYESIGKSDLGGRFGAKRREIYERYGYNCKAASHSIRVMRLGIEFLKTGYFQVKRPDAQELVDIKDGKWTIEQVKREFSRLLDEAKSAYRDSVLPDEPDYYQAENLLINILKERFQ